MITKEYITQLLNRITDTDIDKSRFGPFYNLMLLPIAQISSPIEYRLRELETFQGLRNVANLSEYEVDVVASNHLLFRKDGTAGTATAKVVVRTPADVNIANGSSFTITKDTEKYEFKSNGIVVPASDFSISPVYGTFYVSSSIPLYTVKTNDGYNSIEANSIFSHNLSDSNIVYIIFESMTSDSTSKETNTELYLRLLNSVGQKVLASEAGVITLFNEFFPKVPIVSVYGNSDSEVTRNTIGFFTPDVSEDWEVFNFKGKIAGSAAIPHFAYEYLLTVSGIEYGIENDTVVLSGLSEFLLYEASQTDYEALYAKLSEAYFESGHNIFLSKDTFVTDPEWIAYDAYLGPPGQLHTPNEITISGLYYILGCDLEYIDYAQFVRDILNSNPPPTPSPIRIVKTLQVED